MSLPKRPTSAEDLAALVRTSTGPIRIQGSASTGQQEIPDDTTLISTLRMNKVLCHAVDDMTVTVQAGISLEALQRELAWRDQWLPIDPWATGGRTPGQRTLGGIVATNALGPLRLGIGDWRFLLMGLRWVDPAGNLMKGGGRTVKNVAGYPTHRLLIGSAGALGFIAELTLRTFARPQDEQCVINFAPDAPAAESLLAQLNFAPVSPAYIQIVGGQTFATNPLQLPTGTAPGSMAVVVGFLGRPDTCAAQIAAVRALPAAAALESISQTAAQSGRLRLWMTTEPGTEALRSFQLFTKPSMVAQTVASLDAQRVPFVVAEAGTGVVRYVASAMSREATPSAPKLPAVLLKNALDPAARFPAFAR